MQNQQKYILMSFFLSGSLLFSTLETNANDVVQLTIDGVAKEQMTLTDMTRFTHNQTFLRHEPGYKSEIEKIKYCPNTIDPCLITSSVREIYTTKSMTKTSADDAAITTFVEDIARKIDTDPLNAKLHFDPETSIITELESHVDGIRINIEKSAQRINSIISSNSNQLPYSLELVYTKNPAGITSTNARELGIKELIGKGESDFRGSTKSRIHNIETAAKRFNGLIIAPDEEFSFVSILGPVDGEHGYKEELVIRDNETKPEYGGGICQVSTTVFRGAIYSGMKITQRRNHSYPVHYYTPTGFDATVYVPAPDFRFINNTPGHILLNLEITGTKLVFNYYGTSDGRNVEMDGPHVTERQDNGAMKTYFIQKVTTPDGTVLIDDIFKSNYRSPDDYPHPGDVAKLTTKPDNWSKNEWKEYKKKHGL